MLRPAVACDERNRLINLRLNLMTQIVGVRFVRGAFAPEFN